MRDIAIARGFRQQWDLIVVPWLKEANINIVKAVYTSEPSCENGGVESSASVPSGEQSLVEVPQSSELNAQTQEGQPQEMSSEAVWSLLDPIPDEEAPTTNPNFKSKRIKTVKDLLAGLKDGTPWQNAKYNPASALWQGAGLRRRAHPRRSNKRLGTCSVDLSGPHEATPRPGQVHMKNACRYFLALTVRPDLTADTREIAVQHTPEVQMAEFKESSFVELDNGLTYAALLGTKSEAFLARSISCYKAFMSTN